MHTIINTHQRITTNAHQCISSMHTNVYHQRTPMYITGVYANVSLVMKQMRLQRLVDKDYIQCYHIASPSERIKRMFPKAYIISVVYMGKHHIVNDDKIPFILSLGGIRGYIFTYRRSIPAIIRDGYYDDTDTEEYGLGNTFPACLDAYLPAMATDDDPVDMVLSVSCKDDIMPIAFTSDIVIRYSSRDILQLDNVFMRIVNDAMVPVTSLDDWLVYIITNMPMNYINKPIRYPDTIDNTSMRTRRVKRNNLFIHYDYRFTAPTSTDSTTPTSTDSTTPTSTDSTSVSADTQISTDSTSVDAQTSTGAPTNIHAYENYIVTTLEDIFEDKKYKVVISDSYTGLYNRVRHALDRLGLKYKELGKNKLETTVGCLQQLDIEYTLLDFI